jgi:hypothetical protein
MNQPFFTYNSDQIDNWLNTKVSNVIWDTHNTKAQKVNFVANVRYSPIYSSSINLLINHYFFKSFLILTFKSTHPILLNRTCLVKCPKGLKKSLETCSNCSIKNCELCEDFGSEEKCFVCSNSTILTKNQTSCLDSRLIQSKVSLRELYNPFVFTLKYEFYLEGESV